MATRESQPAKKAKYLYLVKLGISPEKEQEFNDLYESEHVPAMLGVPGVMRATRYMTDEPGEIKYMALYELESSDVLNSKEWTMASDSGLWPTRIRPYITSRSLTLYRLIYPED